MVYKTLNKILILIILSLLVNRVVNGQQFIPGPRVGHTATLLGGNIYYIGGISKSNSIVDNDPTTSDFFYLSLKKNISWVDLKSQGVKFPHTSFHTSNIGSANQDSIFIIEGLVHVYKFDIKKKAITEPEIQGTTPQRREDMRSVSYKGKIYIFGGDLIDSSNKKIKFFNNFDILDTVNMIWQVGSLVNAPPPRFWYTATLFNGIIYYIGGRQQNGTGENDVSMSNIATGVVIPGSRIGHSAILVDDKICIYGGTYFPTDVQTPSPRPSTNQIAMLDIKTLVWSIPPLQNPNIPNLVHHTATSIGSVMLLSFGNITSLSGENVYNDKLYLFNISGESNITWDSVKTQEIANAKALQSPTNSQSSSLSKLVLFSIFGIIGVFLISAVIFFGYKYYKNRENKQKFVTHAIDHF